MSKKPLSKRQAQIKKNLHYINEHDRGWIVRLGDTKKWFGFNSETKAEALENARAWRDENGPVILGDKYLGKGDRGRHRGLRRSNSTGVVGVVDYQTVRATGPYYAWQASFYANGKRKSKYVRYDPEVSGDKERAKEEAIEIRRLWELESGQKEEQSG